MQEGLVGFLDYNEITLWSFLTKTLTLHAFLKREPFTFSSFVSYPDRKVHGANMGPIWDRQDPDGPHGGPRVGPTGPRWAPWWPHESCYLGMPFLNTKSYLSSMIPVVVLDASFYTQYRVRIMLQWVPNVFLSTLCGFVQQLLQISPSVLDINDSPLAQDMRNLNPHRHVNIPWCLSSETGKNLSSHFSSNTCIANMFTNKSQLKSHTSCQLITILPVTTPVHGYSLI